MHASEITSPTPARSDSQEGIRFGAVARLGHVEFRTRDLARLTEYYRDVLGMPVMSSGADATYLSIGAPGQAVSLQRSDQDGLAHIAFELTPDLSIDDAERILEQLQVKSERKRDAEPGIPDLLELEDPEGNTVQLYHERTDS